MQRPVKMGNDIVEQVNCVRFLGIMLDDKLNFCNHVCLISDKISKEIGMLYKLRDSFPLNVLKSLYYSLIFSYISY